MSVGSSSTGSCPSTHESANTTTSTPGVVQENEAMQYVATDLAHVDIGVDDAQLPKPQHRPQEEEQQEDEDSARYYTKLC